MANDVAVGFGGAGGYLEMNVYKPLIAAIINFAVLPGWQGFAAFSLALGIVWCPPALCWPRRAGRRCRRSLPRRP
jgi:hypothetical protein